MPRILSRGGHAERELENVAILADSLDATVEVTANDLVLSAESFRRRELPLHRWLCRTARSGRDDTVKLTGPIRLQMLATRCARSDYLAGRPEFAPQLDSTPSGPRTISESNHRTQPGAHAANQPKSADEKGSRVGALIHAGPSDYLERCLRYVVGEEVPLWTGVAFAGSKSSWGFLYCTTWVWQPFAFGFPRLWFDLVHGAPYVNPQALVPRTGAVWAAFTLLQFIALVRWQVQPLWLSVVAGVRLTEIFSDWVYLFMAQNLTLLGKLGLLAQVPMNLALGIFLSGAS